MCAVLLLRYGLPVAFVIGGIVMFVLEPNSIGLEGLLMAIGAALATFYLNFLFRQGAKGDRERDRVEGAREQFARTGRWPDE